MLVDPNIALSVDFSVGSKFDRYMGLASIHLIVGIGTYQLTNSWITTTVNSNRDDFTYRKE